MAYNSIEPPSNIFDRIKDVDCNDMKLFSIETWSSNDDSCPYFPMHELPFYARIHHINSQFAYITLLMNTCDLTEKQRCYLPLFEEVLLQLTHNCDNIVHDHSALMRELEDISVDYSFSIGINRVQRFQIGAFQQTLSLYIQCEPDKYEKVVKFMWCLLKNTVFDRTRIRIIAQKLFNDISKLRRQGHKVVSDLLDDLILNKKSNYYHSCMLRQQKFLNDIIQALDGQNDYHIPILSDLEELRRKLLTKNNVWLHFAANLKNHQYTAEPWKLYPIIDTTSDNSPRDITLGLIVEDSSFLKSREEVAGQCRIVGVGGMESVFIRQYSPGPLSLSHADIPALYVITQYFIQLEGPIWRNIRGAGLAYDCALDIKPSKGSIEFHLFKATDGAQAYIKTKHIITSFMDNMDWDENLLMSAKNSLVYDLVAKESSPAKLISKSLVNYFEKVDLNFNSELIKKISNLNKDNITEVAKRWLPSLFDPQSVTLTVVCNTKKVQELNSAFKSFGFTEPKVHHAVEEIN